MRAFFLALTVWALGLAAFPCFAARDAVTLIEPVSADVGVRAGDHPGFGRIVFDLPKGAKVHSVTADSRVMLVFSGASRVEQLVALPRNVKRLQVDGAAATLTLAPGSRVRQQRLGDRLVLDLLDADSRPGDEPARSATARPPSKPSLPRPAGPEQARSAGATMETQPGTMAVPTPSPTPLPTADSAPPAPTPGTAPRVVVQAADLPSPPSSPAIAPPATQEPVPRQVVALLPADTTVGAAAFRRGAWGVVVLDRRMPLPVPTELSGAVVSQGPVSTVLTVPIAEGQSLALNRAAAGWSVAVLGEVAPGELVPQSVPDGAAFPMRRIGRAVTILDPATGGSLLVGTSLAAGNDAAVGRERRTPAFTILPTWLGIAVEPLSDQADLHANAAAFVLHGGSLLADRVAAADTGGQLDLPNEAVPALLNRLHAQLASAAGAPPRARSQSRLAAIQAMLALGLGAEAQALVQQAIADDPEAASDAKLVIAGGVAAVLAGRPDEASALDKPELSEDPELDLWRGLRDVRLGRETENARHLPGHLVLARSYPEPLRRLIWPDLVEAAAQTGVPVPADQMTPYAAALALEHADKLDAAIAAWQAVAAGPDRRDQTRATIRGTELQLAAGRIGPAEAAEIMERESYAWRGDGQELALRLRAAELRSAAGGWRAALDLLRATDVLFPDQKEVIRAHKASVFDAMMSADGARLSALEVVMLAADYADCVPDTGKDARLARLLAEKLLALDLPARAIPVLQGLVTATQTGPARAEFGLRLGQLLLEGGDPAAALTALEASGAPELSTEMAESRGLLTARIRAAQGHARAAAESLESIHSAAADDLRASLLGQEGDWKGSLNALNALADKTLPSEGPLPDSAQAVVIREATAAVQADDAAQLLRLGELLPRMSGPSLDMLRMLTGPAITSTRELPRAASELKLARSIPGQIQAVASH
jgi:hypothetical protein